MFSDEKIKNFTAIIQNVTLTIALIVGGIWTFYTFSTLGQQEKAKYDLIGKPSLNIEIETITTDPLDTNAYSGLIINVNIENKGTRYITLNTLDSVLCVTEIGDFTNVEMVSIENLYLDPVMRYKRVGYTMARTISVQPNSKKTIAYYCELKNAGLYFISFLSKNSREVSEELSVLSGINNTDRHIKEIEGLRESYGGDTGLWCAVKYIEIK